MSWNIQQGGGRRVSAIIDVLADLDPDVCCLQEFRPGGTGNRLLEALGERGLEHAVVPAGSRPGANTVSVASAWPLDKLEVAGGEHPDRVVGVRLGTEPFGGFEVVNVHSPHKVAQVPVFSALIEHARDRRARVAGQDDRGDAADHGGPGLLVIGDLNNGVPFVDSDAKTFVNHHQFRALLAAGLVDAWRVRNPDGRDMTWYSPRSGRGFRYDHALASAACDQRIVDVRYEHAPRIAGISDHSLMLVDLAA